jgi:hypothetical protein
VNDWIGGQIRAHESAPANAFQAVQRLEIYYGELTVSWGLLGTGTFNAANWAVWDASDLRGNFL